MKPFTVQSCDNIQGNGDLVHALMIEFCSRAYLDLVDWIENNVTFFRTVWWIGSTPHLPLKSGRMCKNTSTPPTVCLSHTCESYRQWVIEDNYCNGRPDWTSVRVQLVLPVKPYEKIKVKFLNAGHSELGYAGLVVGNPGSLPPDQVIF
jgi:mannitol-1-phosphate/altronate dehydrogenase